VVFLNCFYRLFGYYYLTLTEDIITGGGKGKGAYTWYSASS